MPRLDTTVEARRVEVAQRYLRGEMQSEIARSFGVSQQQISQDLRVIRAHWLASAIRDFDAAKAQELAKIDEVERAAWSAWERSTQDKEVSIQETDGTLDEKTKKPKMKKVSLRREGQAGAPAFLNTVLTCIERRCAILGLDAPKRFVITDEQWARMTPEQLERLAKGEPPEKVLALSA